MDDVTSGLKFRHESTGHEIEVVVKDKYPTLGELHVEGRRTIEVTVEHYVELISAFGYRVVDPNEHQGEL